jgi:hypothetical protein
MVQLETSEIGRSVVAVDIIIDFSNESERKLLYNELRKARGKNRITISKYRRRRSDRQNRFYWPCAVVPFAEFLREQGEPITNEMAHEMLKMKFLPVVVQDAKAGDLRCTRSTTELDTQEFNAYLDHVSKFLHDFFGIVTPEPDIFHERS